MQSVWDQRPSGESIFHLSPYSAPSPGGSGSSIVRGDRIALELKMERHEQQIQFCYVMTGERVRDVVTGLVAATESAAKAGARRDELWKTTCFEFFLGAPNQTSYYEINLALNHDWNAYAFDDYREGQRPAGVKASPVRDVRITPDAIQIAGDFSLRDFQLVGPVVLGATAVVEYQDGQKEYWALAHKGSKPDFHLRDSFTARV